MAVEYKKEGEEMPENTYTFAVEEMEFVQLPEGQGIESVEYDGKVYKAGEFIKIKQ